MTPYNGPRTEAGDTWPPAIEHPAGSVPTNAPDTRQRELRQGRSALKTALTGIGLAVIATGIGLVALRAIQPRGVSAYLLDALCVVYFLGIVCEVMAVVKGSIARKTRMGQWGLAISLSVLTILTAFLICIVFFCFTLHHDNGVWPWQKQLSDDGCCHDRIR